MGTVKMVSAVLIILLLAIIHIANPDFFPELWRVLKSGDLIATAEYIESFGSWAVFFSFWLVLFVNMLGFPPAIIFSTANTLIFGIVPGIILSVVAETVGVVLSFLILRFFLRDSAKKIISDYVLSSSMNAYHVAQASVQQAQAQLAMAQTTLGYCTVRSPITGIIKENGFKIGEVADLSNLLCTVSDDSEIQAWFSYTESQLLELLDQYNLKPSSEGLKDIDGKSVSAKLPRLKQR